MQAGFHLLGPGALYPPTPTVALLQRSPAVLTSLPTLPGARLASSEPGSIQSLALTIYSDLDEFLQAPVPATGPIRQPHISLRPLCLELGSSVHHQWCLSAKESGQLLGGKLPLRPSKRDSPVYQAGLNLCAPAAPPLQIYPS